MKDPLAAITMVPFAAPFGTVYIQPVLANHVSATDPLTGVSSIVLNVSSRSQNTSGVKGEGLQGLSGSLPLVTSVPSDKLSLSVSGSAGSVPIAISWSLVSPSPSQSSEPAVGGLHSFNGSVPLSTSSPSVMPSPSVSGLVLSVPASVSPSLSKPSLSQSFVPSELMFGSQGFTGSVPASNSSPSLTPSLSVSASPGSVPAVSSSVLVRPSLSQSAEAIAPASGSQPLAGSLPLLVSSSLLKPSPSQSANGLAKQLPTSTTTVALTHVLVASHI